MLPDQFTGSGSIHCKDEQKSWTGNGVNTSGCKIMLIFIITCRNRKNIDNDSLPERFLFLRKVLLFS